MPQKARPTRYQFTSANDIPDRDPRQWTLEGSRDGKTWVLLDERTKQPAISNRQETKSYDIARPGFCRFFRFKFSNNPGVPHFQIAEIALEGVGRKDEALSKYHRALDLRNARRPRRWATTAVP